MLPRWVGYVGFMLVVATATFLIIELVFGGRW